MFFIIQTFIALCPIIPLAYIVIKAYRFDLILNKRSCIKEKQLLCNKIKDFFPKTIKQKLETDHTAKKFADEVLQSYRKLFFSLSIYLLFGLLYFISIIVRISLVFRNYYDFLEPGKYRYVIGSILMSIFMLYWFLLTPVFEFFHGYKPGKLKYHVWTYLQFITTKMKTQFIQIVKYCHEILFSFLSLFTYIALSKILLIFMEVEMTFWIALLLLILYQYMILKLFSRVLQAIIKLTIKKLNHLHFLEKYTKNQVLYLHLKNCTYLSMVLVYAAATDSDKTATPIVAAIGVLFLIDTFFAQEKSIQEMIEDT